MARPRSNRQQRAPPKHSHRETRFKRRLAGLKKKTADLCTLCGVEALIVCTTPDGRTVTWPEDEAEARRIAGRYRQVDAGKRARPVDLEGLLDRQSRLAEGARARAAAAATVAPVNGASGGAAALPSSLEPGHAGAQLHATAPPQQLQFEGDLRMSKIEAPSVLMPLTPPPPVAAVSRTVNSPSSWPKNDTERQLIVDHSHAIVPKHRNSDLNNKAESAWAGISSLYDGSREWLEAQYAQLLEGDGLTMTRYRDDELHLEDHTNNVVSDERSTSLMPAFSRCSPVPSQVPLLPASQVPICASSPPQEEPAAPTCNEGGEFDSLCDLLKVDLETSYYGNDTNCSCDGCSPSDPFLNFDPQPFTFTTTAPHQADEPWPYYVQGDVSVDGDNFATPILGLTAANPTDAGSPGSWTPSVRPMSPQL